METAFWEHWERQQWEDTMGFGRELHIYIVQTDQYE